MTNLTTYSAAEEATPEAISTPPSIRANEGTLRTTSSGIQEVSQVTKFDSSELYAGPGSILATAQNNGFPAAQLLPTTTIELERGNPGSRTTLAVAEQLGFIAKNEYGQYVPTQPAAQAQQVSTEAATEDSGAEPFAPETEKALSESLADVPSQLIDQAMASAAASIAADGSVEDFAESIASTTGIPLEKLQGAQSGLIEAFQGQADSAIKALGVDPQELYDWARANHPQELNRAVREQVFGRSLSVYRQLANAYMQAVPPSLETINTRYQTKAASGRGSSDMVTIQGMQMEVKTAARLGFI